MIESIHKAARKAIGAKQYLKSNKIWWTEEIEELIEGKKKIYLRWLNTKSHEDREAFRSIKRRTRQKINHLKSEMWDRKCREIEGYIGGRRNTEAWKFIEKVRKTGNEEVVIQNISQEKWKKHYEQLLKENRQQYIQDTTTTIRWRERE